MSFKKQFFAMILLAGFHNLAYADAQCEDSQQYKLFEAADNIELGKLNLATSFKMYNSYRETGDVARANEQANQIRQSKWLISDSFYYKYKPLGGRANSYKEVEDIQNPCGTGHSKDGLFEKLGRNARKSSEAQAQQKNQEKRQGYFAKEWSRVKEENAKKAKFLNNLFGVKNEEVNPVPVQTQPQNTAQDLQRLNEMFKVRSLDPDTLE